MDITTDALLDMLDHITEQNSDIPEFVAKHGISYRQYERISAALVSPGDGRSKAFQAGLVLGLQVGAMRLDPVEYDPAEKPPCNCIACQIERALGEGED